VRFFSVDDGDDNDDDDSGAQLIKVLMEAISSGDSEECAVCLESLNDPVITPCAHVFCCGCITDIVNSEILAPRCPMCRAPVDETDLLHVPEEQRNKRDETIDVDKEGDEFEGSAKVTKKSFILGYMKTIGLLQQTITWLYWMANKYRTLFFKRTL
jgi:hypothetical protein